MQIGQARRMLIPDCLPDPFVAAKFCSSGREPLIISAYK
jgi:hypothetical protein